MDIELEYVNLTGDEFGEEEITGLAEIGVFLRKVLDSSKQRTNCSLKLIEYTLIGDWEKIIIKTLVEDTLSSYCSCHTLYSRIPNHRTQREIKNVS